MYILELESKLVKERNKLSQIRKRHYQLAGESEGWEVRLNISSKYQRIPFAVFHHYIMCPTYYHGNYIVWLSLFVMLTMVEEYSLSDFDRSAFYHKFGSHTNLYSPDILPLYQNFYF